MNTLNVVYIIALMVNAAFGMLAIAIIFSPEADDRREGFRDGAVIFMPLIILSTAAIAIALAHT